MILKRNSYINQIRPFINKQIIKVLTGLRRSGKSVMLLLIQEELINIGVSNEQFITLNLESGEYNQIKDGDTLYRFLSDKLSAMSEKTYLFLDEIQEVINWETCINSLFIDFDVDIYLTGSNANLLSGELATYLAGRYVETKIYPFSYIEFLDICRQKDELISDREVFTEYLKLGGMPFLINLDFEEGPSHQYLTDIYNSVVLKEVMQRNSIRDTALLERIIKYVIANIGHTFSAKSLSDFLKSENRKVAPETVYNYIKACENACLFHIVKRQDLVGKRMLQMQEKIYLTDHGIRQAIYGNNTRDIDQILENIVYMELLRRGYNITIGKVNQKEINFVAEKRNEKIYIQVAYLLASEQREFSTLLAIKDNFPKYVVSMDELDMSYSGIKHMHIRDFLQNISF